MEHLGHLSISGGGYDRSQTIDVILAAISVFVATTGRALYSGEWVYTRVPRKKNPIGKKTCHSNLQTRDRDNLISQSLEMFSVSAVD